ncbi:L-xylulose reductase-like [Mercenaria mercenaria]|uniref:L-xylulose reductase-like n=1 Tax=Mercenaria mercenaria TaxID=6596 RepID=UPI00234F38D2|nr:L-xylulose reductase-like [Mercenaria mercenaria]
MPFDFSGKNVLVTGATRGMGRLLTKCLSSAGAEVYGLGSNRQLLDTLKVECENVHTVHVDLADWKATRKTLEQLPAMNGLVNNAGVSLHWVTSLEAGKDVIDKTFAVNVMAAVNVTQVVGKKMVAAGKGGSIVNVSSVNGLNPNVWRTICQRPHDDKTIRSGAWTSQDKGELSQSDSRTY